MPAVSTGRSRQGVGDFLMVRIQDDQKSVIRHGLAEIVGDVESLAIEHDGDAARPMRCPVILTHLAAVGGVPGDVLFCRVIDGAVLIELAPAEIRMSLAQLDQPPGELEQALPPGVKIPVEPADLVVLAVGIVVAALRAPDLVSSKKHGNALAAKQRGQEISLLALAAAQDGGILRWSFNAQIPGVIIVGPILVRFAVGLVVLVVVADQVLQGKAVVSGGEIEDRKSTRLNSSH